MNGSGKIKENNLRRVQSLRPKGVSKMDNDEVVAQSPLPEVTPDAVKELQFLNFYDAMREVVDGKRITKAEWKDENTYGLLSDAVLKINIDGEVKNWIIGDGDLLGLDFYVLE